MIIYFFFDPQKKTLESTYALGQRGLWRYVNKVYSTFPKASGLKSHHQMEFSVIPKTLMELVLLLCRDVVDVFYRSINEDSRNIDR